MVCVAYGCKFATSDLWSNCFVYKGCVSSLKYQQYNDNYPDHSASLVFDSCSRLYCRE